MIGKQIKMDGKYIFGKTIPTVELNEFRMYKIIAVIALTSQTFTLHTPIYHDLLRSGCRYPARILRGSWVNNQ